MAPRVATHPPARPADLDERQPLAEFPIHHGGLEIGVIRHSTWLSQPTVDLAASIFAHPLLREIDRDVEERRLFGTVLQSVMDGENHGRELRALLLHRDIDPDEPISVVIARTRGPQSGSLETIWGGSENCPCASALIDEQHISLLQGFAETAEHARQVFARLDRAAPRLASVGIGVAPGGAVDLRAALLEAREAMQRGIGINERMPLTIDRLLCALPTDALQEHTRSLLEPVIRHDTERQTELIKTLRVLVAEDFSIVRAAKTLFVHRNTVKYRAGQIGELTGLEVNRLDGRVQLWIAITLLDQLPATRVP